MARKFFYNHFRAYKRRGHSFSCHQNPTSPPTPQLLLQLPTTRITAICAEPIVRPSTQRATQLPAAVFFDQAVPIIINRRRRMQPTADVSTALITFNQKLLLLATTLLPALLFALATLSTLVQCGCKRKKKRKIKKAKGKHKPKKKGGKKAAAGGAKAVKKADKAKDKKPPAKKSPSPRKPSKKSPNKPKMKSKPEVKPKPDVGVVVPQTVQTKFDEQEQERMQDNVINCRSLTDEEAQQIFGQQQDSDRPKPHDDAIPPPQPEAQQQASQRREGMAEKGDVQYQTLADLNPDAIFQSASQEHAQDHDAAEADDGGGGNNNEDDAYT